MIDAVALVASYVAGSAAISLAMARFSPSVGPRLRTLFAGSAPLAVVFATILDGQDSVTLFGPDLLAGGALLGAGLATAYGAGLAIARSGTRIARS